MLQQAQHERNWAGCLIAHTATPPVGVKSVAVDIAGGALSFTIDGGTLSTPLRVAAARTDGLWQTTCFEMFVKPVGGDEYFEFNFSPSTAWAAYRFTEYRGNATDLEIAAPVIEPVEHGVRVEVDLSALPPPPWRVGLTAVIEEIDGTKSYWALAHPDGPPDFHANACFALEVPAAD